MLFLTRWFGVTGSDAERNLDKEKSEIEEITARSEEHTSELQSRSDLVCRLLLEKKKKDCNRERSVGGERRRNHRGACQPPRHIAPGEQKPRGAAPRPATEAKADAESAEEISGDD